MTPAAAVRGVAVTVAAADEPAALPGHQNDDAAASGDTRNLWPPYSASNRAENGLASCSRSGSTPMAFLEGREKEKD